ncbi:hypothetical protein R1flu_007083 [Riccia fluitans]|uniref:Uncharacterized protein n=1 Tax=Riccia fluitans TaxID=41844 RepID=A0ABD1Z0I2_9MARC
MGSSERTREADALHAREENEDSLCPPTSSAHDITSMSDLPPRRMKTKMWPMSPIETLTEEEVLSIANRDKTPVMIAVLDGDTSCEQYLCGNKRESCKVVAATFGWNCETPPIDYESLPSLLLEEKALIGNLIMINVNLPGASLPPEVAAEGSWAQKYYQQVAVLSETLKEMQESFQPVWELAKSQQALLVSVEIYDGLLAVANQGMQLLFKSWNVDDRKAIITKECDFRTHKQADYYSVLKNYTTGRFDSLDPDRLRGVEELLTAGETYLVQHARTNGFECPSFFLISSLLQEPPGRATVEATHAEIRAAFQEFLPLKKDRNQYSHPLTLARKALASSVLQKLRVSLLNDEFDFIKGTKDLMLMGADYAETILENYGKVRHKLFLDPNKRCPQRFQTNYSQDLTPLDSPGATSPPPNPALPTTGESSQSFELNPLFDVRSPESPPYTSLAQSPQSPLGSPLVLTYPDFSRSLRPPQQLSSLEIPSPRQNLYIGRTRPRSPQNSLSPESSPTGQTQNADPQQSSDTIRSPRNHKRPKL